MPNLFRMFRDTTPVKKPANKKNLASESESSKSEVGEFDSFDLVLQKKGFVVYRNMMHDDQVKPSLLIKKLLMLCGGWEITTPAGLEADPEAMLQLAFIKSALDSMSKSFYTIMLNIMSAFQYGFSVSEKNYERRKWTDGKTYVFYKGIKTKMPDYIEFVYDAYANLEKLLVSSVEVPQQKFVIFSYLEEFENKKGESDLKSAYNAYWMKNNVWKFWARHLERYGSPMVKGKVPIGATTTEQNNFFSLLKNLHNLVSICLPRTKDGTEFDFELVETKREGGTQFLDAIENADSRILRSFLLPRLFGFTKESSGSHALGLGQMQIVFMFLKTISKVFSDEVVCKQIVNPLIDLNFPNPKYPVFKLLEPDVSVVEAAVKSQLSDQGKIYPK